MKGQKGLVNVYMKTDLEERQKEEEHDGIKTKLAA